MEKPNSINFILNNILIFDDKNFYNKVSDHDYILVPIIRLFESDERLLFDL